MSRYLGHSLPYFAHRIHTRRRRSHCMYAISCSELQRHEIRVVDSPDASLATQFASTTGTTCVDHCAGLSHYLDLSLGSFNVSYRQWNEDCLRILNR
jgi:hypothetical protein